MVLVNFQNVHVYFPLESIGTDELEDPLIGLGLVSSREEVLKLIEAVDDDKSGNIEFKEFLKIMTNIKKQGGDQDSVLYSFFTGNIVRFCYEKSRYD